LVQNEEENVVKNIVLILTPISTILLTGCGMTPMPETHYASLANTIVMSTKCAQQGHISWTYQVDIRNAAYYIKNTWSADDDRFQRVIKLSSEAPSLPAKYTCDSWDNSTFKQTIANANDHKKQQIQKTASTQSTLKFKKLWYLQSQTTSGFNKICIYTDNIGGSYTKTVNNFMMCPATTQA